MWMQLAKEWYPCPLCIIQRYVYLMLALFSLIYLINPRRIWMALSSLVALTGVGVGGYHLWVLSQPSQSCGVDPLQVWLNDLPWAKALPDFFQASGLCTDVYPPWLGLSIPAWGLAGAIVMLVLTFGLFMKPKSA